MKKGIHFNLKYFLFSVLLFIVEVVIAVYLSHYQFIRAYLGDVIVVMLIYSLVLTFFDIYHKGRIILGIFIFSVAVEVAQYFHIADRLGFQQGSIPHIVIGNSFSWWDMVCYGVGCVILYGLYQAFKYNKQSS